MGTMPTTPCSVSPTPNRKVRLLNPVYNIPNRIPYAEYPVSLIPYPVSRIPYPMSRIPFTIL